MREWIDDLKETPSQTAGPYVHIGLAPGAAGFDIYRQELGWDIAGPNAKGDRIRVEGRVLDGMNTPVKDALIEVWQANAAGIHAHPEHPGEVEEGFRGWGRVITDFDTGVFTLDTIKPGCVPGRVPMQRNEVRAAGEAAPAPVPQPLQAPHLNLWIVARGINLGLNTRLYFSDEVEANAADPVLNLIEWEKRRATLIAHRQPEPSEDGRVRYLFDICLQGETETVFFEI